MIIDSSVEKVQKPYKPIYELAQKKSGFEANEILFIDNSQKNIDTARELGWQTFLYDSSNHQGSCQKLSHYIKKGF